RARAGPEEQRLLEDLGRTRAALSSLVLRGPAADADRKSYRKKIASLTADEQRFEEAISARTEGLPTASARGTIEAIQQAIPEGSALVELLRYQPYDPRAFSEAADKLGGARYVAYVLKHTGEPRWTFVHEGADDVDRVVGQVRKAIQSPASFAFVDP